MKATLKIAIIGSIFSALSILSNVGFSNKPQYLNKGQYSSKSQLSEKEIEINEENFPDEKLREYVTKRDNKFDGNGILSPKEISKITWIELKECKNLKGIENFTACYSIRLISCDDVSAIGELDNLTSIQLMDCKNVNVDLSKYTGLTDLTIRDCELKYDLDCTGFNELRRFIMSDSVCGKITVKDCAEFVDGDVSSSKVEEIYVENCPKMHYLDGSKIQNLKKYTMKNCPTSHMVHMCVCPELTDVEVIDCEKVKQITVLSDDKLSKMTVKGCPFIEEALKDTDKLEVEKSKTSNGIQTDMKHENGTKIKYNGDIEFITK